MLSGSYFKRVLSQVAVPEFNVQAQYKSEDFKDPNYLMWAGCKNFICSFFVFLTTVINLAMACIPLTASSFGNQEVKDLYSGDIDKFRRNSLINFFYCLVIFLMSLRNQWAEYDHNNIFNRNR